MNPRVLELLKNPKNIQSEDLDLLKEEINSFPYIQNVRALHLYGVHLYDKGNYQKELSTTAAYTTDKKILYQLINGKIQQKLKPEIVEEKKADITKNTFKYIHQNNSFPIKRDEKPLPVIEEERKEEACLLQTPRPEIKDIYVNGERNRILFEGEENFLDDHHTETIDLESTLESGSIVTQKIEKKEPVEEFTPEIIINEEKIDSEKEEEKVDAESDVSFHEIDSSLSEEDIKEDHLVEEHTETEAKIEFTPEEIINEEEITSETEEEKVNNDAELSFHGTDSFLPDVKIQSNTIDETINEEIIQPADNKHEDEMRRLIEEVEKKMRLTKASSEAKEVEVEVLPSHEISFGETQGFHVASTENKVEEKIEEAKTDLIENKPEEVEAVEETKDEIVKESQEVISVWKPMSFDSHVPDSLLKKTVEIPQPKIEIKQDEETLKQEEILPKEEVIDTIKDKEEEEVKVSGETESVEDQEDEAPVMNVSFFNSDIISSLAVNTKKEEKEVEEIKEVSTEKVHVNPVDSNVPGFINTWQSWLKIDRPSGETEKVKAEIKNKVIESFIENNPRISQLKDEVNFVVKEKTDDISHLMTETLATLYFEQKLYTKAINAFYILINKHPGKKKYFEEKIKEIKDTRGK